MRLPDITTDAMSPAQKAVHDSIAGGARGGVRGPFLALLHSPDLAGRVEQLGVFVRYECSVPQRLRELSILAVARHWRAEYEWFAHAPIAEGQGLPKELIDAFGEGETPVWPTDADNLIMDFCEQLLTLRSVSDDTYQRTQALLGVRGSVDLVGLIGYYSLLALTLNAHDVAPPDTAEIPWLSKGDGGPQK